MNNALGDLANMTLADLKALYAKVEQQIEHARKRDLEAARLQIQEIARSVGLSVLELAGAAGTRSKGMPPKAPKASLPALYCNPANNDEQWSGRGRPPAWVKASLAAGGNLDAFRITAH